VSILFNSNGSVWYSADMLVHEDGEEVWNRTHMLHTEGRWIAWIPRQGSVDIPLNWCFA
jgi:hypothetical protein